MKRLLLISLIIFCSCNFKQKDYKYQIDGYVKTEKGIFYARWYVDTIQFRNDTIFCINSNELKYVITPPYILKVNGSLSDDDKFRIRFNRLNSNKFQIRRKEFKIEKSKIDEVE